MTSEIDSQSGYLVLGDMSDGVVFLPERSFVEFCRNCSELMGEINALERQLDKVQARNAGWSMAFGALYERLQTVQRAWYTMGLTDALWGTGHQDAAAILSQLQTEVVDFPVLLEDTIRQVRELAAPQ